MFNTLISKLFQEQLQQLYIKVCLTADEPDNQTQAYILHILIFKVKCFLRYFRVLTGFFIPDFPGKLGILLSFYKAEKRAYMTLMKLLGEGPFRAAFAHCTRYFPAYPAAIFSLIYAV